MPKTNFIIAVWLSIWGVKNDAQNEFDHCCSAFNLECQKPCPKLILSLLVGFQSGVSKTMPKTNFIIAVLAFNLGCQK
jgi:hypothetical protein